MNLLQELLKIYIVVSLKTHTFFIKTLVILFFIQRTHIHYSNEIPSMNSVSKFSKNIVPIRRCFKYFSRSYNKLCQFYNCGLLTERKKVLYRKYIQIFNVNKLKIHNYPHIYANGKSFRISSVHW